MNRWSRLLSLRLAIQLGLILLVVFGLAAYFVQSSIESFSDRVQYENVQQQAGDLMKYLRFPDGRTPHLDLPPAIAEQYQRMEGGAVYVLADESGKVIEASTGAAVERLEPGLENLAELSLFNTAAEDGDVNAVYGLTRQIQSPDLDHESYLVVGQFRGVDERLLSSAAQKTLWDMLEVLLPLFGLSVVVVIATIYWGFRSLRHVSMQASTLGPESLNERLMEEEVPAEVQPLVRGMNRLLDRLELSFTEQRHFVADTAHQLRTPIAIMQARLEQLKPFEGKTELTRDVETLGRFITQLLNLAQLESQKLNLKPVKLNELAHTVVSDMAPLAVMKKVKLNLDCPKTSPIILADTVATSEALKNLIDNALAFSSVGKTIEIEVKADGTIHVLDRGPGVDASHQPTLFRRLWRNSTRKGGAGLGLAIVAEIMRQPAKPPWLPV